ncbi:MAG: hypothetical protein JXA21_07915 [Anaerolineae bacterium]|nr:hypothetical protein [Anaerolineae bacterium]
MIHIVQCGERQYRRGRAHGNDRFDLILEGYHEPRADELGRPYVALIATSVTSMLAQNEKKLAQIREQFVQAEDSYEAAGTEYGDDSPQA